MYALLLDLAVAVVPGASGATLALPSGAGGDGVLTTVAASDPKLSTMNPHDGPQPAISVADAPCGFGGDLSAWPAFALAAASLGLRDAIVHRLVLDRGRAGCLTLYSEQVFDAQALVSAGIFCRHAGSAVANVSAFDRLRRLNDELEDGLRSREVIGLAKGILMRQERCSEADAFRILVSTSQRLNKKVRHVAQNVVALAEGRTSVTGVTSE